MVAGCSTLSDSMYLGVGSGALTGAAGGVILYRKNKPKMALQGALFGAVIGGVASYLIHGSLGNRDKKVRRETLFNLEKHNLTTRKARSSGHPSLSTPEVEKIWVEPYVEGDKYVEGHHVWVITDEARWSGEDDNADRPKEENKNDK